MGLKAFQNCTYTKEQTIARIQEHIDGKCLVTDRFWDEEYQQGCHTGCLLHDVVDTGIDGNWDAFEPAFGIPQWIDYVLECIHEKLPEDQRVWFFENALPSIPIGADEEHFHQLQMAFSHWLLVDPEHGMAKWFRDGSEVTQLLQLTARILQRELAGEIVLEEEREGVRMLVSDFDKLHIELAIRGALDGEAWGVVQNSLSNTWEETWLTIMVERRNEVSREAREAACVHIAQKLVTLFQEMHIKKAS